MKRLMSDLLVILLVLSLFGCGSVNTGNSAVVESDSTDNNTFETSKDPSDSSNKLEEENTDMETKAPSSTPDNTDESELNTSAPSESSEEPTTETTGATENQETVTGELDEVQKNSIAMLNYLATLSQEINSSKNSRLYLEEAYASLINDINPEMVDETTESQLASMLDIIEKYRMITVKRDRLQYIYEQNQANAIRQAVPNPIGFLSAVSSFDMKRVVASVVYMAVDSASSYLSNKNEIKQEFLQDGWELDDEEAENVHESRKRAFMFMIDIVRENNLPGKLALNETSVNEFVTWKNKTNIYQKIQFFESEESTYEDFDEYWLTLAGCYYENGDYDKCLEAFAKYEEIHADIFRKDRSLAEALPQIIAAGREVYSDQEYVPFAEKYIKLLVDNTELSEWALRYFAAQMYLELYAKTNDVKFLDNAYALAKDNVNYLVDVQRAMNVTYLADVKEVPVPDDATKDEKNQIKDYNQELLEARKVELPPVYEPLVLNCELLFALAEEKDITSSEQTRIEGILHHGDTTVFLDQNLENQFTFNPKPISVDAEFKGDTLIVPANVISETSFIKVTVTESGDTNVYTDWVVKEVERESDEVGSYKVSFTSKECDNQKWSANSIVKVEIYTEENSQIEPLTLLFEVDYNKRWWIIPDSIDFMQVK